MLAGAEAGSNWTCTASVNLQAIGDTVPPFERVSGNGVGTSEEEACRNAKRAAMQAARRGTYARHCRCRCART
jgi:hypothetical protein